MAGVKITGVAAMIKHMEKHKIAIKEKTLAGMIDAAIVVRRDMEATMPLTPVDWGNLRSSFFVATVKGIKSTGKAFRGPDAAKIASDTERAKTAAVSRTKAARNLMLIMGYGANYAIWVHEMTNPDIEWKKRGAGPKWFEVALKRNKTTILALIGAKAKITTIKGFTETKGNSNWADAKAVRTDVEDI